MIHKRWEICGENELLARRMAQELSIRPVTAQILINRGITTIEAAKQFFETDLDNLWDPFLFSAMDRAVERLLQGIRSGEKIVIFGDYDVDGITGTSLLRQVFTQAGAHTDYYIPDRSEGYGMNPEAVRRLAQGGYTLIVTVDNGISCLAEVELACSLGMDVIITDHHEPPEVIPPAYAVINPKVAECGYPFPYLAGVGVAFKLCQALAMRMQSAELMEYTRGQLDLVTLGTIADIVPLVGENRMLASYGLKAITHSENPGIRALIRVADLEGKEINTGHVGFGLGPRINAIGRMDNPCLGVELLTTRDPEAAAELADKLNQANRKRQMMEEVIVKSAVEMIEAEHLDQEYGLVLASEDWHHGIIGIAASKLVDRYYRPTVLISIHEGIGKGSARSVRGLNLYEALNHCKEYLLGFGGHEMAAGLSIHIDRIEPFRAAFQRYVESVLPPEERVPYIKVDSVVEMEELDFALLDELQRLEPHGPGNPRPVLELRRVAHEHSLVGANRDHLKLQVIRENRRLGGIGFGMAAHSRELRSGSEIDLIFQLERNHWQGRDYLQLMLADLRPAVLSYSEQLFAQADRYLRDAPPKPEPLAPSERRQRRRELTEKADRELIGILGGVLHCPEASRIHTSEGHPFYRLLNGQNVLTADGVRMPQTMWLFAAYQALRWERATVILSPTRSQAEHHALRMGGFLRELGLCLRGATGSLDRSETAGLIREWNDGEIDILATTPAFWEFSLNTDSPGPGQTGFIALDGFGDFDPAVFSEMYPGVAQRMTEPGHPPVMLAAAAPDERMIGSGQSIFAPGEVVFPAEDCARLTVLDGRMQAERDVYLAKVASDGEKSLIWVHSPEAAVQTALSVQRLLSGRKEAVLYYHEGLPRADQEEIIRRFRTGEASVLAATDAFQVYDIADIRHVLFYHLSPDENSFLRQCRMAGLDGQAAWIHCLFGSADQAAFAERLSLRAPERDLLVKIYIVLDKLADHAGELRLSRERFGRELGMPEEALHPVTLEHALRIFADLRLLELEESFGQYVIRMLPKPKQKLDLSSSIRYNEGVADKSAFYGFCKVALEESTESILERINRPFFLRMIFEGGLSG